MLNNQMIPCPVCKNNIPFHVETLLTGGSFACSVCMAVVSLAPESTDQAKDAMGKFEELKKASMVKG